MADVEKYIPIRINKDTAPDAQKNGQREYMPGEMVDALNCRYIDVSNKRGVLRNTPGNELKSFSLPAGDNICIGSFEYEKENTLIYHIYNSNNDHRVVEWDKVTNQFRVLLQGSSLNYDKDFLIVQGGVIDSTHIWNDRKNRIRRINIIRARAGEYTLPYNEAEISLALYPPLLPPTAELIDDTVSSISLISNDTWQFAYRFVYRDNEETVFSPLSKLVWPGIGVDAVITTKRAIQVTIPFPEELEGLVKKIEIAFRRGNNGDYTIFNTVLDPTGPSALVTFRNNESKTLVSSADEVRLFDNLPDRSEALGLIESRVIILENESGFNEHSGAILTAALNLQRIDSLPGKLFFKEGGVYGVGIVYFDQFGKPSFVENAQTVSVPYAFESDQETVTSGGYSYIAYRPKRNRIAWTLSGTPPAYAAKYQIVLSHERTYSNYFQCKTNPHLYVRDIREGETDGSQTTDHYFFEGKMFRKMTTWSDQVIPPYQYVYLQIPLNVPFIPDTTCYVRFNSKGWPTGAKRIIPVIDVIGQFLVIDLKYTRDDLPDDPRAGENYKFPWWSYHNTSIEVFKPSEEPNETFFEVGEVFDVVDGNFSVLSGFIYGDTYNFNAREVDHSFVELNITGAELDFGTPDAAAIKTIESPSGILSSKQISTPIPVYQYKRTSRTGVPGVNVEDSRVSGEAEARVQVKTLDYTKAAADFGRIHTELKGAKEEDYFNNVLFSEPYIQNTKINGLSTFIATNNYPVAVERSKIRMLLKVQDVLLAIHERNTTSLYVGEGILKQGNDFIQVKIDQVIGDDRQLGGRYGTINPESAVVIDGMALWWDGIRGAVVRYTKAGLFPVSIYGLENYFQQKGLQYFPYRNTVKIVAGFDHTAGEYVITFPDVIVNSVKVITGVTWAFNIKNNIWTTRYSFLGERYQALNNDFLSFNQGQIWIHNSKNVPYNNFYGVQYERKARFICNPALSKEKLFLNVHLRGQIAQDLNSDEFAVIRIYTPQGQETFIPANDFSLEKGKYVAAILKDINSIVEAHQLALRSGDDIISHFIELEVICNRIDEAPLSEINLVVKTLEFSI